MSIFDRDEFNERLFFPRTDASPAPAGAVDHMVAGAGARLHVRIYAAPAAAPTLLLFHGNGEVVADYDDAAAQFARRGAALACFLFSAIRMPVASRQRRHGAASCLSCAAISVARCFARCTRGPVPVFANRW